MKKNTNFFFPFRVAAFIFLTTMLVACGGGSEATDAGGGSTSTGTATLGWTPPTTYTDGSALGDLAGYKIYYGTESASYDNVVTLTNPGLSAYVIEGLAAGTYYFVITAYNDAGVESVYSNEEILVVS